MGKAKTVHFLAPELSKEIRIEAPAGYEMKILRATYELWQG
jgi:hypothetical protein